MPLRRYQVYNIFTQKNTNYVVEKYDVTNVNNSKRKIIYYFWCFCIYRSNEIESNPQRDILHSLTV